MEFHEYPKALCPGGDAAGVCRIVDDAEQERALRAEGYAMVGDAAGEANAVPVEPVRKTRRRGGEQ